ncbi:MAG: hypothetical protein H7Z37_10020 [Pyrinomonadaceae bacterium]|nr:hypothetical protein [Pyrinomonadaceae bacterium]
MLIRITIILICIVTLGNSFEIPAQNKKLKNRTSTSAARKIVVPKDEFKITLETVQLPKNFYGQNAMKLSKNLNASLKSGADITGKKIYGNLTTNDLFAFTMYSTKAVYGSDSQNVNIKFEGRLFRLQRGDEFPEPETAYGGKAPCISTRNVNSRNVSSRGELVKAFATTESLEAVWRDGVFRLRTEFGTPKRRNYKGFKIGEVCDEFFVPSPQSHYDLSFVNQQPFGLFDVTDDFAFSLDDYDNKTVKGAGVVAWKGNDVLPKNYADEDGYVSPLFVVKLVAPYVARKTFTKPDPIENKPHVAIQNKIYVDIVGIWLYNQQTGEIVSKDAGEKSR